MGGGVVSRVVLDLAGRMPGRPTSRQDWLTSNLRLNPHDYRRRVRAIRLLAALTARHETPITGLVDIRVTVCYPTRRHADAHNAQPAAKAAIDGLVDAGLLAGDDERYVRDVTFSRGGPTGVRGTYRLTLELTEIVNGQQYQIRELRPLPVRERAT